MAWKQIFVCVFVLICLFMSADAQKKKKPPKKRIGAIVREMETNMTELWREVKTLSQPVHVHIHGDGHVMGRHDHDLESHNQHCHGEGHDHTSGHQDHNHEGHDHEGRGHEGDGHGDHGHEGHKGHDHEGHKDKGHHNDKKGKKGKGKKGHDDDESMKKGHGHGGHSHEGHGHEGHRGKGHHDMDEDYDDFHHGSDGTHVHIHLHTALQDMVTREMGIVDIHPQHLSPVVSASKEYRYARCEVVGNSALPFMERQNIRGSIFFRQMDQEALEVKVDLQGFTVDHSKEGDHSHLRAVHGHSFGDLSNGCQSMGGHFNPHGVHHGGPEDSESRHPGDFGNLRVNDDGTVMTSFEDKHASLFGGYSLLGRGLVIHAGADDMGKGGDSGSKSSGNAGARIACCAVVACAKPEKIWEK